MTTHASTIITLDKTWSYVKHTLKNNFIPLAIDIYGCLHYHFNSFLTTWAKATIAHHQRSSLIPRMNYFLLSTTYIHNPPMCTSHCDSSTWYHALESILISSTIIANTLPSQADLWQTTPFQFIILYFISVLVVSWLLCSLVTYVLGILFALSFLWMGSHPCPFFYKWGFSSFCFGEGFSHGERDQCWAVIRNGNRPLNSYQGGS
jgi:hypothetical protein